MGKKHNMGPKIPCTASLAYLLSSRPQKVCLKNKQTNNATVTKEQDPKLTSSLHSSAPANTRTCTYTQSNFPTAQLKIKVADDSGHSEPSKEELFKSSKSKHCIRTRPNTDESCHPVRKGYRSFQVTLWLATFLHGLFLRDASTSGKTCLPLCTCTRRKR